MLELRRGTVVEVEPLTVEVSGERRRAWADVAAVGEIKSGDEVVVNVAALDLGLGSGGFDLVHVNLTRGLDGEGRAGSHVMKLNYTSLQHAVQPVEPELDAGVELDPRRVPVAVIHLHGHLAPVAWAAAQSRAGLKVGYVQTAGGALPGALSLDVPTLTERGLLCGDVTAGASHGGQHEAVTVIGGLDAAARSLGWDAIIAGPGPGILGSSSRLGHGGMIALDNAHAALALGLPTLLAPRLSSADPRPRHRGLSHHTRTVLELLLAPVRVPAPELDADDWPLTDLIEATKERHDLAVLPVDLEGYGASGLPTRTMGRDIGEDPLFFAGALAAGRALAEAAG